MVSFGICNEAIYSVHDENRLEYIQSIFQELEILFRTIRTEEDDTNFNSKNCKSIVETYEIPPGI